MDAPSTTASDAEPIADTDAPLGKPNYPLHGALFVATCATTYYFGGGGRTWFSYDAFVFAATLMGILLTHEMGHFVVARRHGIDASPPFFIPIPAALGTLGAVIRMRASIRRRDALIDVGAAGPLAGLLVAVPLLIVGLINSPVVEIVTPSSQIAMVEGNSLLYFLIKLAIFGRTLPSADGFDVQLGPMAMAAWWGFFLTFMNLLPIGQLDGGHVAHAYFGNTHEKRAPWLHGGLVLVGLVVFAVLFFEASAAGRSTDASLRYGAMWAAPWVVWSVLLLGMRRLSRGQYHPPVSDTPLSPSRRALFWLMVFVFLLLFTPVPLRESLPRVVTLTGSHHP